jgi:hypothetical protein
MIIEDKVTDFYGMIGCFGKDFANYKENQNGI